MKWTVVSLAILVLGVALASEQAPHGKRVLALFDDLGAKSSYSTFFRSLEGKGYSVDYRAASDRSVVFRKYGEWKYDHLILFSPTASDLAGIAHTTVLEFIDQGHNVIIAGDSNLGSPIRKIASDCNIEFAETGGAVYDHINYDVSDVEGRHTLIAADNVLNAPAIFRKVDAPVLFRGTGMDLMEGSSLLFPALSGYSTSYAGTHNGVDVAGKKTVLVAGMQARNNARVVFSGSLDLFSDKFFSSGVQRPSDTKKFAKSGNEAFVEDLVAWALQEKGVLRVKSVSHHRVGETEAPATYTIKEDIVYTIELEEWNGQKWVPFNKDDVQLEYRMIDPYVRTTLKNDGKGKYTTTFKLPDVYGVFTFKVEYVRLGLSRVESIVRTPVRPFRHNQYERFIDAAYPYYTSALSMIGGLFFFSWFFLFTKD